MTNTTRLSSKRSARVICMVLALILLMIFAAPIAAQEEIEVIEVEPVCSWTHLVRIGDTLGQIARYYGTTVADLVELNDISNPNLIFWGRTLCISTTVPAPEPFPVTYKVQPGDTLGALARFFGVTIGELALHNGIGNIDLIFAGENLTVPGVIVPAEEAAG